MKFSRKMSHYNRLYNISLDSGYSAIRQLAEQNSGMTAHLDLSPSISTSLATLYTLAANHILNMNIQFHSIPSALSLTALSITRQA